MSVLTNLDNLEANLKLIEGMRISGLAHFADVLVSDIKAANEAGIEVDYTRALTCLYWES